MNAATMLWLPWRSISRASQCSTVTAMGLFLAAAVLLAAYVGDASMRLLMAGLLAYVEVFVGMLVLAPCLSLAVDAKELRIPRAQRWIVPGMVVYGALWVAVPVATQTLLGGSFAVTLVIETLGLVLGLAIGLLPPYAAIMFALMPVLFAHLKPLLALPHPSLPTLASMWVVTVLLACACMYRWRRWMQAPDPYRHGINAPLAELMRGRDHWSGGADHARTIRFQPSWLRSVATLRRSGPTYPQRSLRILFGGCLLPKTRLSALTQWMIALAPILLAIMVAVVVSRVRSLDVIATLWRATSYGTWAWFGGCINACSALVVVLVLQQRWQKPNAELPLLALLPGLGRGKQLVRHLLQASLLHIACMQFAVFAVLLVIAAVDGMDWQGASLLFASQIASICFAPAFALAVLGGARWPAWRMGLAAGALFMLLGFNNIYLPFLSGTGWGNRPGGVYLIAAWIISIVALVGLGWRGWAGLRTRPHPFLSP